MAPPEEGVRRLRDRALGLFLALLFFLALKKLLPAVLHRGMAMPVTAGAERTPRAVAPPLASASIAAHAALAQAPPRLAPSLPGVFARELSVADLLLAAERRTPARVRRRFIADFSKEPALMRVFDGFRRRSGDQAAARELIAALADRPEFGALIKASGRDPGFRTAFEGLTKDAAVAAALKSAAAGSRETGSARPGGPGGVSGAAFTRSLARAAGAGRGGYDVKTTLGGVQDEVGDQEAARYLPSAFVRLSKADKRKLQDSCDRWGFCDTVSACRFMDMWAACHEACAGAPACPAELYLDHEPDIPIIVR